MNNIRLNGLATGFDTDQMVKDLSKAHNARIDSVKKERQLVLWKQEAYRDITGKINDFTDSHFNLMKPETNFRSPNAFAEFSYDSSISGNPTNAVEITANGDLEDFDQSIQSVSQLATKDTWTGTDLNLRGIKSSGFSIDDFKTTLGESDFKVSLAIDGTTRTVQLSNADVQAITNTDELVSALNSEIVTQFGTDFGNVVSKSNIDGNDELVIDKTGNDIRIMEQTGFASSMDALTVASGTGNLDYENKALSELFDFTGIDLSAITVNGVGNMDIDADDTIDEMIQKVNTSDAGVTLSYSNETDSFVLQSAKEGSANDITLAAGDTVDFFSQLGVEDGANRAKGQNAHLSLNGADIVKSSNTFTMDGMTYTLNETYDGSMGDISLNVTKDTDAVIDNVKSFVEEYNNVIEGIQDKIGEKKNRDYPPLTDEQKEAMSDEEVEKWETMAKEGLLANDRDLQNIVNRMRQAVYEKVEGVGISMADIGITTSSDYKEGGKLIVDETKLKSAVENNYNDVVDLFTSQSDKSYLDTANQNERYNENGVANRLHDIFQDAVRTTRDSNSRKGTLVEKAGIENDSTLFNNTLQKSVTQYDERINDLLERLYAQEDRYYAMFARMETAMAQLQNQSQTFMQQLGGGAEGM
ncbi:MAG: flagellar filament capping protein FliD [Chitinispirillaceae bacterium]